jgi:hypothetical protein
MLRHERAPLVETTSDVVILRASRTVSKREARHMRHMHTFGAYSRFNRGVNAPHPVH